MWLHKLFNPHCSHCLEEIECRTCHELRSQLDFVQAQNKVLIENLIPKPTPIMTESVESKPIGTLPVPWHVKRAILEKESRHEAEEIKKRQAEIDATREIIEEELETGTEDG